MAGDASLYAESVCELAAAGSDSAARMSISMAYLEGKHELCQRVNPRIYTNFVARFHQ